ncbi:MFS transporter [Escherichia coli]
MLLLVRVFDAFADVFAGRVVDSVNTRWGKNPPVFTLRYCAVNHLQRAGILGTDRLEP